MPMLTPILAFISTNIDDILVLTILLTTPPKQKQRVCAGYILGVLIITAISILAAQSLRIFPHNLLRLLGFIPITLGVRAFFHRSSNDDAPAAPSLTGAMLITLGNSADNLGVYVPLFARSSLPAALPSIAIFLLMAALWSFLAARIASLPALRRFIEHRSKQIVPALLILLGLYILIL